MAWCCTHKRRSLCYLPVLYWLCASTWGTASVIKTDHGTGNVNVAAVQRFFRPNAEDDWAGRNRFLYGKSVSNQWIEAWWGRLGKDCTKRWIDFSKDMRSIGLFCDDVCIEEECVKFCFMNLLRVELYQAARLWKLHQIRLSTNVESLLAGPMCCLLLFFLPEVSNTRNFLTEVDWDELELAEERCCYRTTHIGCFDEEFVQLASIIMEEKIYCFLAQLKRQQRCTLACLTK